ncbi:MAG: hypothetical protein HC933_15465 [Pleurocapsa sp. SU_196_0]|nr:hypothetical protein [Pleurocapsa sp. SU_196_0]
MPQRATLASDRRISLELADDALEWLPLHPFGAFVGNGINCVFDETSMASVRAQLEAQPTGKPLDFHHATVKVEEGKLDRAPRAAQIVDIVVRDGYVYGRAADWVKGALESVKAGEFGFVSSVLYLDDENRVVGYHSHALTNNPGTYGQRRIGLETDLEVWYERLVVEAPGTRGERVGRNGQARARGGAEQGETGRVRDRQTRTRGNGGLHGEPRSRVETRGARGNG